ncbi:MAG: antitoxin family protein [Chloroflexales bacterium]
MPESPEIKSVPASRVVRAVYCDGLIRPEEPLDLPEGTPIQMIVPTGLTVVVAGESLRSAPGHASGSVLSRPLGRTGLLAELCLSDALILSVGLLLYALTRLVGLTAFPIYFFCDEAIQTNLARALLANGLRSADGTFLPPYFLNAEKWNLSLSIYVHLVSTALFGSSAFLTRATSVAVSGLALVAVALALRLVFQNRFWWAGPLALTVAPAWFLHSRTAFETVMMVAFYACFLCCYLLYRTRGAVWAFPAIVFGAMTFYAYANGQGVMLVSGVLLLLSDLRYHLRQGWRVISGASAALLVAVVPLARFRVLKPDAYAGQMRALDSYWTHTIPLGEKLATFGATYLAGMSPTYWFLPNTVDLERHRMAGMGHLPLAMLPFIVVGLGVCVIRLRSPIHRVVLVAVLAAPFSSALVAVSITRVLAMVVPAAILFAIGLDCCYRWVAGRLHYRIAAGVVALTLSVASLLLLRTALTDGPTWFTNYGMAGMQYGAQQLFGEAIPDLLAREPDTQLLVSPTWANNPNAYLDFFLSPIQISRVQMINIDAFTVSRQPLDPARQIFVMPPDEYERAVKDSKFIVSPPERIIPYPNDQPGFYVVRMRYVDNVDTVFAADRAARAQLVAEQMDIGGPVTVAHSLLDMGTPENLFDDNPNTLIRGFEANPLVIELRFAQPRSIGGVKLTVGSMNFTLRLIGTPADGGPQIIAEQRYNGLPPDPTVSLDLPGGTRKLSVLRLEISPAGAEEVAHVHVRDLALR